MSKIEVQVIPSPFYSLPPVLRVTDNAKVEFVLEVSTAEELLAKLTTAVESARTGAYRGLAVNKR